MAINKNGMNHLMKVFVGWRILLLVVLMILEFLPKMALADVPESDKIVVNLGEVHCKPE